MRQLKIIGVKVFLEKRKRRMLVGELRKTEDRFVFTYDDKYFRARNVISLGPEFPLTEQSFTSEKLFPFFEDRIPSLQNPAYPEYCLSMGIDPKEKDPFILLSTIGRKGPSSFIFYPSFDHRVTAKDVMSYRESLGFTTREFADVFELSQNSLNALERNRASGSEILKRLEIILHFPNTALYLLRVNGGVLSHEKWKKAFNYLTDERNKKLT